MDAYLRKAGLTRGNVYLMFLVLTGGGYVEKHHNDDGAAMQAQIAALDTSLALCQQSQGIMKDQLAQLDRDVKALTRAVDRLPTKQVVAD